MNNTPKVSVITIFYNRQNSVKESVQSLINQNYPYLDIIIIDDCSMDHTFEELTKFKEKDSRIRLYRNDTNTGFTNTLIRAIDLLDSKYVAIHGAGDISLDNRIEEQVRYLEENPSVGVLTLGLINEKENLNIQKKDNKITRKDLLAKNFVTHGSVMFKLSDYKKVGGYRSYFTTRQDKDLWYRMSLVADIHTYPKRLYKIIEQDSSVTKDIKKNPIPLLLSEFAKSLFIERLIKGYDSLDKYGDKAALFYNPTLCNKHFYYIVKENILRKNFGISIDYLDILISVNVNFFQISIYKILRSFLKGLLLLSRNNRFY